MHRRTGTDGPSRALPLLLLVFLVACSGSSAPSDAPDATGDVEEEQDAAHTDTDVTDVSDEDPSGPEPDTDVEDEPDLSPPPDVLPEPEEDCGPVLRNRVDAPSWVTARAGIAFYDYSADTSSGEATVVLRDASDATLGVLTLSQRFGDPNIPDGAMAGSLIKDDGEEVTLWTRGFAQRSNGHDIEAVLARNGTRVHVFSTVEARGCWEDVDRERAPPCAGTLDLQSPGVTLPTCGQLHDTFLDRNLALTTTNLHYRIHDAGSELLPMESIVQGAAGAAREVQVFDGQEALSGEELQAWLGATGADQVIGTDGERLLTSVWLDRSLWRTVERHVAHCDVADLPSPVPVEEELQRPIFQLCPGQQDNQAWGGSNAPSSGSVWGDPHLVTLDGYGYDLHAAGEFVVLRTTEEPMFEVQGRFQPLENPEVPACGTITWNTAAAVAFGGVVVAARSYPDWELTFDGVVHAHGAPLPALPEGHTLRVQAFQVEMTWPDGSTVAFRRRPDPDVPQSSLSIFVALSDERMGEVEGLLGGFDGDPSTDLRLPSGQVLSQPASFEVLHGAFADAWRTSAASSLFPYRNGEEWQSFQVEGFPDSSVRYTALPAEARASAEAACRAAGIEDTFRMHACVLDIVCTGSDEEGLQATDAPRPKASQVPGREVRLQGAVVHGFGSLPEDLQPRPPVDDCRVPEGEPLVLHREADDWMPTENLALRLVDTRELTLADLDNPPVPWSDENPFDVWHVARRSLEEPQSQQHATLTFARAIVGVVADSEANAALDTLLFDDTEADTLDRAGVAHRQDRVSLSPDRRTLTLRWTGSAAQRLRVLVEATP